jgi:hypothetical protein
VVNLAFTPKKVVVQGHRSDPAFNEYKTNGISSAVLLYLALKKLFKGQQLVRSSL